MIIQCDQCQTRFKIPDDKVSAKGVKVRCAKCQHTFRVFPSAAVPPAADPFALFDSVGNAPTPLPAVPPQGSVPRATVPATDALSTLLEPFDMPSDPFRGLPTSGDQPTSEPPDPFGGTSMEPPDPFGSASSLDARPPGADFSIEGSADHSFFEMPPETPPEAPQPEAVPSPAGLLSDIPDLAGVPEPAAARAPTIRVAHPRAEVVSSASDDEVAPKPPPAGWGVRMVQTVLGAALFALLGGGILISVNGGRLPRPSLDNPSDGSARVLQVSSGLYDTQSGKPVLFVRGQVANQSGHPERLRVRAELREGSQTVRTGDVLAGVAVTPEDLYRVGATADLEALRRRLETEARPVAPGERAPFVIAFYEFPSETDGLAIHVTANAERP